ncbi:MAG: hypothetical protein HFACDABA_02968 [Anaerolineales bacterium]|nr:hypothetical protein [Anaerolineales bacterium]
MYKKENDMKQRTVYLITAGLSLLFALGLLLMPSVMLGLFDMNDTEQAAVLGQLISVELVVGGAIMFLLRDTTDPKARNAIHFANIAAGALGVIVSVNGTLTGAFGWFGWVMVVVYLLLAAAFAYLQFFAWGE